MEVIRQTIHAGKNEPTTSIAGACAQPLHSRQIPARPSVLTEIRFMVADHPDVEWETLRLLELDSQPGDRRAADSWLSLARRF